MTMGDEAALSLKNLTLESAEEVRSMVAEMTAYTPLAICDRMALARWMKGRCGLAPRIRQPKDSAPQKITGKKTLLLIGGVTENIFR